MSTFSPPFSVCSVKQKHSILLKYLPAWSGLTLNIAWPVVVRAVRFWRGIADLGPGARRDPDGALVGLEPPRQAGLDIGVEADPDLARDRARRALGALRGAAEARSTSQNKR